MSDVRRRFQPITVATVVAVALLGNLATSATAASKREGRGGPAVSAGAAAMPLNPPDRTTVRQNPPDFSWPVVAGEMKWDFELRGPDGKVQRLTTGDNRISLSTALAPGEYEWSVRPAPVGAGPRRFTVPADAPVFAVPEPQALLKAAASRQHPRFRLRIGNERPNAETLAALGRARDDLSRDLQEVSEFERRGGRETRSVEQASAKRASKREGQLAAEMLAQAALGWHLSGGDRSFSAEGRRRLLEAASWDPEGSSGTGGAGLVARDMAWSMALLYDAVYGALTPAERSLVTGRIIERADGLRRAFLDGGRMQRMPMNSIGWVGWGGAAAAASMVAGDDPRADALFLQLVPSFIASISPWGGADGGFAGGTGYGYYDVGALVLPLDMIGSATGVDLFTKPWLRNVGRFLTYNLPPGADEAPFGDAFEISPSRHTAWTMRALAQRVPDPLLRWNAGSFDAGDKRVSALQLGAAGNLFRGTPYPANNPHSAVFDDIGWAALHSNLGDARRVSVYFKSSSYGSGGHSHADQNAFVLHAAGRPLLKGTGYYDFFESDHHRHWYQATRAHNAITFDGGTGQPVQDFGAQGRLVFSQLSAQADIVTGDATTAYAGLLTKALRTIVYLRPNLVIVHDRLASQTPRRWEWNLHADRGMSGSGRSAKVDLGDASVCVDMLQGPETRFSISNRFAAEPRSSGQRAIYADQMHGTFAANEASTASDFVVALRVGCTGSPPRVTAEGKGWLVTADVGGTSRTVALQGDRAELR